MNLNEFKKNMENPRFKAAVYLSGYLLLGFVLILLAKDRAKTYQPNSSSIPNTDASNEMKETTDKDLLRDFHNYAYKITLNHTVNELTDVYVIEGMRYNDEELFTYPIEEDAYYIKNNQYYQVFEQKIKKLENDLFPINLIKLKPENLSLMIETLNPTLENKINGLKTSTYYIPLETFIYYYDGTAISSENMEIPTPTSTLKLEIMTKENSIQKIEIDLTNFVNQKEPTLKRLTYCCEFSNQNTISDWNVSFEEV